MKKIILIISITVMALTSCKKSNLPEVGGTSAQSMANEWWVTFTVGGQDVYGLGHVKIATYNSSANTNEMWVDDFQNSYGFKVKAAADFSALTFTATNAANEYYDSTSTAYPKTATITNGKVFPGQGRSKTGNVTDSIYFQIKFSDDPNTTYTMAGVARTRFAGDDY